MSSFPLPISNLITRCLRAAFLGGLVGVAFALVYLSMRKEVYISSAIVTTTADQSSGRLAGIATQLGIGSTMNSRTGLAITSDILLRISLSPSVMQSTLASLGQEKVNSEYEILNDQLYGDRRKGGSEALALNAAERKLRRMLFSTRDRVSGTIEFGASSPSGAFSAAITSAWIKALDSRVRQIVRDQTMPEQLFLAERIQAQRSVVDSLELRYRSVLESNRSSSAFARSQFGINRLEEEYAYQKSVLQDLKSSYDDVRLRILRDGSSLAVLESPKIPIHSSNKPGALIILAFALTSALMCVTLFSAHYLYSNILPKERPNDLSLKS